MRLLTILAVLGLFALAGCPKPATKTDVVVKTDSTSGTTVVETPQSADGAAPEGAADSAPETAVANGEATGETARRPSKEELKGKWFALYGGVGMGAKTYTYEDGHQLEFLDNGMAIWELTGNGGNNVQLVSKFELSSNEITLTMEKPGQLQAAKVGNTPLAFGRDDEVGLTGSQTDAQPEVFRFTPELDGQFLALKGMKGELMVYGRVDNAAGANVPDVSGDWVLVSAPGQQDDVTVTVNGDTMETEFGAYHTSFKGKWSRGYFIGPVVGSAGMAYAAVMPKADGTLDGVISTEPYSKWQATFDFTRAAK